MEVFPMSVRTITEDTVIDNICYDDLIVTSGANVTLKGTLYGNVDVKDNSHFQLNGIMRGNLFPALPPQRSPAASSRMRSWIPAA